MPIQAPDLSKFKKPSSGGNKKSQPSATRNDDNGNMLMGMGNAALAMMPKWAKYAIGVAVFFLVWGLVSFNYCMIVWFGWYYLLVVLTVLILVKTLIDSKLKKS